jgi:hypothetical protein
VSAPEQLGFDDEGEEAVLVWCAWCGAEGKVLEGELEDDEQEEWYCSADCRENAIMLVSVWNAPLEGKDDDDEIRELDVEAHRLLAERANARAS